MDFLQGTLNYCPRYTKFNSKRRSLVLGLQGSKLFENIPSAKLRSRIIVYNSINFAKGTHSIPYKMPTKTIRIIKETGVVFKLYWLMVVVGYNTELLMLIYTVQEFFPGTRLGNIVLGALIVSDYS